MAYDQGAPFFADCTVLHTVRSTIDVILSSLRLSVCSSVCL